MTDLDDKMFMNVLFTGIAILAIVITFSALPLFNDKNTSQNLKHNLNKKSITANVIQEINLSNNQSNQTQHQEQLYSNQAYGIFYIFIITLIIIIIGMTITIILPRIKDYT